MNHQETIFWKDQTIEQAREYVQRNSGKGSVCPCCEQYTKTYARPLGSAMAYGLILLYKASVSDPTKFIHIEDHFKTLSVPSSIRGDLPKLRFWGLIESQPGNLPDGNPNNGLYRVTQIGRDFVLGRMKLPSHAKIYNNQLLGFTSDANVIDIHQALKNKFNYKETMGIC